MSLYDHSEILAAQSALSDGNLIHLPTETVYGLAGRADRIETVARIFAAKGRPSTNPLIVHIADLELALKIGHFDVRALKLAHAFWPGPLTLVVPLKDEAHVCEAARAKLQTVALRMPHHPMAQAILHDLEFGVVAPSANRSGRPSPTTKEAAYSETGAHVSLSLDGGACQIGLESSVVAVLPSGISYLRSGAISAQMIEEVCKEALMPPEDEAHRSPGRLFRHYAPNALLELECLLPREGDVYLSFGPVSAEVRDQSCPILVLSATRDLHEAAHNLFDMMSKADAMQPNRICVAPIPHEGIGHAINDRLRRAAGFVG